MPETPRDNNNRTRIRFICFYFIGLNLRIIQSAHNLGEEGIF